jgi:hypothetical protein
MHTRVRGREPGRGGTRAISSPHFDGVAIFAGGVAVLR